MDKNDKTMPWLKVRLRQVNKTPAGLARHLDVAAPRVYEMIGGRRGLQPHEMRLTAEYLDWSVEELASHLPAESRLLPMDEPGHHQSLLPNGNGIPVLATTEEIGINVSYDAVLTGETNRRAALTLEGRKDVFCLYAHGSKMLPWRKPGELVLFEKARPPSETDHVVIWMLVGDKMTVIIRQLMPPKHPDKIRVSQHNPHKETEIDRAKVSSMFRVMTWDDIIR